MNNNKLIIATKNKVRTYKHIVYKVHNYLETGYL